MYVGELGRRRGDGFLVELVVDCCGCVCVFLHGFEEVEEFDGLEGQEGEVVVH